MNIFDDGKSVCICCSQRIKREEILFNSDWIGLCKNCHKKLSPVSPDSPFEGTEYVKYIISAYYYNERMKKLVHKYKFNNQQKVAEVFTKMLFDYIKDIDVLKSYDFMTAIPLGYKRFLKRGYNQAEVLAKQIANEIGISYVPCVYRCKNTKPQSSLKRRDRAKNISDAFVVYDERVKDKNIILFDDIFTTGSTLNSCAKALKEAGAKSVSGLTLSVVNYG